jgi:hypothetical protein
MMSPLYQTNILRWIYIVQLTEIMYGELSRAEKFSLLYRLQCTYFFQNLQKRTLVCNEHDILYGYEPWEPSLVPSIYSIYLRES